MSIASRIQSIEQHLEDDYSVLELAGADLTNVDKNIVNLKPTWKERLLYFINNGTDEVYDNWDKVTGEGTSLTLNNTLEAKMKIVYKGNTYQYSTTGKNKFDKDTCQIGKNWNSQNMAYSIASDYIEVETGKTYQFSVENMPNYSSVTLVTFDENKTFIVTANFPYTIPTETKYIKVSIRSATTYTWTQTDLNNAKIMISTTGGDYEPYTGGIPSPNPDYPQDIQVVSGDNKINITGKNVFDESQLLNATGWTLNSNGYYNGLFDKYYVAFRNGFTFNTTFEENTQYTIQVNAYCTGGSPRFRVDYTDNTSSQINLNATTPTDYTFTTTSGKTISKIVGEYGTGSSQTLYLKNIQVEKGTTATTYEPYKGASYPIYLGVENIFNPALLSQETNYNTYDSATGLWTTNSGGSYGRSILYNVTGDNTRDTTKLIKLAPNTTYTLTFYDFTKYTSDTNYLALSFFDSNGTIIGSSIDTKGNPTFTTPNQECWLDIKRSNNSGYFTFSNIQIEMGSKANHYTPYGTTPIELCKIGTYQDKIDKSTGKNLFDKDTITSGYRLDGSGGLGEAFNEFTTDYIEVKSGKTYIRNYGSVSAYTRTCFFDENKTFISKDDESQSFTIPNNVKYIRFSEYLSRLDTLQFEEGTSVTSYEPYGTSWYVNKQIGKVVLDGSDTGIQSISSYDQVLSYTGEGVSFQASFSNLLTAKSSTEHLAISNYFNKAILNDRITKTNIIYSYVDGVLRIATNITNKPDFKTWLSTHNTTVYYVLATPTYTLIEGELLNQLETIKMSYEGQTNISQSNNDLASVLNASALQEM